MLTNCLHICLVAPLLGKSATGLSSYILDLVPRLCDEGHTVTVLGTDCGYRGGRAGELIRIDERARVKVFNVSSKWNRRLYRSSELVKWFKENIAEFDVVDLQGVWTCIAADVARVCTRAGVPYVVTPHGMMTKWDWEKQLVMKYVFFAMKLRRTWRHAAAVRYLSDGELRNSQVGPASRYVVIPNAVGLRCDRLPQAERRARESLGLTAGETVVLFLGRVTDQKGVLELLEAFEVFGKQHSATHLVVAGPLEGAYGDAVQHFAHCRGQGRVHVIGPAFGDLKQDLFAAATLFVTLSKNEGLSIASLEALAMGVPVVVTRGSNLPEAEEAGAGITTVCDPEIAARDIGQLLADPCRIAQMRANALALATNLFSWQAVLPKLIGLYRELAKQRAPDMPKLALDEGRL